MATFGIVGLIDADYIDPDEGSQQVIPLQVRIRSIPEKFNTG
jgi:hypothetical protein